MGELRILFVYQYLTPGGVEAVILARMQELVKRQIDCRALFFCDLGGRSMFDGLEDRVVVAPEPQAQLQAVRDYRPTHLVTFDTPQILRPLQGVDPSPHVVYEVHTIYAEHFEPLRDRELMQGVDRFLVPSEYQREVVQGYLAPGTPIGVVPDSLMPAFLEPLPMPLPLSGQPPILLWVGRLDETKHWQGFLHIGDRLVRAGRSLGVRLWMVGGLNSDEPAQARLWAEVKSRRLERTFRWLPAVDHRAMPFVYRYVLATGGCLLSTSQTESFGVAVLEAMACGLPVVVPEVGALVSLVEDGRTGRRYRFGDVEGAHKAVQSLLEDGQSRRRIGEQAAGFARRYSMEQAMDGFLRELTLSQELDPRPSR